MTSEHQAQGMPEGFTWIDNHLFYRRKRIGHYLTVQTMARACEAFICGDKIGTFPDFVEASHAVMKAALAWLSPLTNPDRQQAQGSDCRQPLSDLHRLGQEFDAAQATSGYMQAPVEPSPIVSPHSEGVFPKIERCHADRDGDCNHPNCPQLRDGEPAKTGRHCPIDTWHEVDEE